MEFDIAVLGGDGIGPEVTAQSVRVLESAGRVFGHSFRLEYGDVGGISIDNNGTPLLPSVRDLSGGSDSVLFGAVGGPKWDDPTASMRPEDGLLQLRAHLGVFANIRPVKVYPLLADSNVLKPEVLSGVDMVVVRELTGGLYYALPKERHETPQGWTAVDTLRYNRVRNRTHPESRFRVGPGAQGQNWPRWTRPTCWSHPGFGGRLPHAWPRNTPTWSWHISSWTPVQCS